ncbi:MAG: response regulator [Ardenticatenales bacterium]|nr:response regulator [Ardenticatenales bacterium]
MSAFILIVENDAGDRIALLDLLAEEGYEVETVENGMDALESIKYRTPALIILDMMMPLMDGYTFLNHLQTRGLWPGLPVIVMTASPVSYRHASERIGRQYCILKPFELEDMLARVRTLVGGEGNE